MKENNEQIEQYRIKSGPMGSDSSYGNNGAFIVPMDGLEMSVIISDGMGWDHVSVALVTRIPTWDEMCYIKNMFWNEDESVVQFHPKKAEYKNFNPNCLHLWKKQGQEYELPLTIMV